MTNLRGAVRAMRKMQDLHALLSVYGLQLQETEERRGQVSDAVAHVTAVQRRASAVMQNVFGLSEKEEIAQLCAQVEDILAELPALWARIHERLNGKHAETFRHVWRQAQTNLVSVAAFSHYLTTERLLSKTEAEHAIGVSGSPLESIALEDYLLGLCSLPNELSRYCLNLVTAGKTDAPASIAAFVSGIYSAFQLLNLRNDLLRKRYDSIKYDLQRIESVVYDVSIRKLHKQPQ